MKMKGKMLFRKMAAAAAALTLAVCPVYAEAPEGTYFSELTGLPTDASLKDQRPVAVIVDNESLAYPHFGTAEGDVVYELINSTQNGHITRLMVLLKDWAGIQQMGSIRSVRSTNIPLAAEWNAVICHDGGPFYVDEYFKKDYARDHFSGTFSRVNNGKSREFTEYILPGDLDRNFQNTGASTTYNSFAPETESHFCFVPYGSQADLAAQGEVREAGTVKLPFEHTNSTLVFNQETGTYDYYCYGKLHTDGEDNEVMTFENVLIQECDIHLLDENGYMVYNYLGENLPGYYITEGRAIPITWTKTEETGLTTYRTLNGDELQINRGKTYISLVPDDMWDYLYIGQ